MERVSITERPDWREKATEYGFNFHTMYGEPYWSEEAYYKLSLAQVEKLEEVTAELHQMCLQVVEKVIASDELMAKFRIPKHTWGFVRQSWKTNQPPLYSRLDLAWDGVGEPKLLENNADTPLVRHDRRHGGVQRDAHTSLLWCAGGTASHCPLRQRI